MNKNIAEMMEEIRRLVAECEAPEIDVLHAVVSQAVAWNMRLEELQEDES